MYFIILILFLSNLNKSYELQDLPDYNRFSKGEFCKCKGNDRPKAYRIYNNTDIV